MNKIWKRIENYDDYYISNFGDIIKDNYKSRKKKNGEMKNCLPYLKNNGYLQITLYQRESKKSCKEYIHRLVAKTFIPNPNNHKCINHINGIKTDNRVENLEWCSYKQNMAHAFETGLCCKRFGIENKNSKKYVELDNEYNYIRTFIGSREENKRLGYTRDTIERCARGITMETHNKIYLFYNDYFQDNIPKTRLLHYEKHKRYLEKRRLGGEI